MNEIETRFFTEFCKYFDSPVILGNKDWKCAIIKYGDELAPLALRAELTSPWFFGDIVKGNILLIPQHVIGRYRLDFYLSGYLEASPSIGIEIDGHEWHEKTKQQAVRDKKRDRAILTSGCPIMRFTGSEIYRNVKGCISEALLCKITFAIDNKINAIEENDHVK